MGKHTFPTSQALHFGVYFATLRCKTALRAVFAADFRSLARAMPSPKPFKNMDREHQVGPWPHSMQPSVKIWWFQFKLVNTNLSIIYYLRSPQLGSPIGCQNTANTHFPCKIGGYPEERLGRGTPMGPPIRPSAPLVHAKNSTKHNTFCILEPQRPLFDANGHSQALVYAISCENTKL